MFCFHDHPTRHVTFWVHVEVLFQPFETSHATLQQMAFFDPFSRFAYRAAVDLPSNGQLVEVWNFRPLDVGAAYPRNPSNLSTLDTNYTLTDDIEDDTLEYTFPPRLPFDCQDIVRLENPYKPYLSFGAPVSGWKKHSKMTTTTKFFRHLGKKVAPHQQGTKLNRRCVHVHKQVACC